MPIRLRRLIASLTLAGTVLTLLPAAAVLGQSEEVVIRSSLRPPMLEIPAGTTVTWRNADDERHRMRSRSGPEEFDSGNLEPGEAFSFTFSIAGTYPYLDEREDDDAAYFGTIVVSAADGTSTGPDGTLPDSATVSLFDERFTPGALSIVVGGTVTWNNDDGDDPHTVTSDDGLFTSDVLEGGATYSHTFDQPGTYPYTCLIHPEMRGTVTVAAADGTVPSLLPSTAPSPSPSSSASPAASPDAPASGAGAGPVTMLGREFQPASVEVAVGETVAWVNDDGEGHTVTASDGSFDSGIMMVGVEFSETFEAPGTFDYFCAIHPQMQGTVTVTE